MPDRDTAKKDVASTICLKLKEMGELTKENLLPVDHRVKCTDFDQDSDEKTAEGTRKNRACYIRNVRYFPVSTRRRYNVVTML